MNLDTPRTTLVQEVNRLRSEVLRLQHELRTDPLTGVWNRRFADERLQQEAKIDRPVSVILADLDLFKSINDTYGHDVGDVVLRTAAKTMEDVMRASADVCRWGGEEFLIVCPNTYEFEAIIVASRIRRAIGQLRFAELPDRRVTLSAGVSQVIDGGIEQALKRADEALYAAKRNGRNQVRYSRPTLVG